MLDLNLKLDLKLKLLLSVLLSTLFLSGCAALTKDLLKDPDVKVVDFSVKNIASDSLSIDVKLNINNPNAIPLKLAAVGYNLKFSGQEVTSGTMEKGLDIPAHGANDITVPLTFKYNALGTLIDGFLKKKLTREYEISGTAKMGLFSIPFQKKGEVEFKK